jgi:hypothetical protein
MRSLNDSIAFHSGSSATRSSGLKLSCYAHLLITLKMPWALHQERQSLETTPPVSDVLQSPQMSNSKRAGQQEQYLLRKHCLHQGLYRRVAKKLGLNASYVSRVASGERTSERIMNAIVAELKRIERQ